MAGANSFFYGDKLLTTGNQSQANDDRLMAELGLHAEKPAPKLKIINAMTGKSEYNHDNPPQGCPLSA